MADRTITAEAIITAKDGTGDVFAKIGAKLEKIGHSAKSSKAVGDLCDKLDVAAKKLQHLEKLQANMAGFAKARTHFNDNKAALEAHARAMKAMDAPTKKVTAEYERLQGVVSRSAAAFEKAKAAAIGSKRAMEAFGAPTSKIVAEQARLQGVIDKTTHAIEKQAAAENKAASAAHRNAKSHRGYGSGVVHGLGHATGLSSMIGGYGVIRAVESTGEVYRHFDKERRYGQAVMGLTDAEQAPLVKQAIHMGATTRFNDIQVLEAQRDLAARGLKKEQIIGMMGAAADLGMAADLSLPDSVKQMEGAIFGFKKDISSTEAAKRSARQTADVQVKAMKISGMTPEDIKDTYKYGATPARLSGVSEQTLLAFGGISKKANMAGNEAGTAFRALMSAANAPTRGAKEAMLANHLDYSKYQRKIDHMDVDPFVKNVAAQYGVKLNKSAVAGLTKVFNDPKLLNDQSLFTPAVTGLLKGSLGKQDAKSLKSIAGMANRFRTASGGGADVNAMLADLMTAMGNGKGGIALANAIFGAKQGGRIANALGDPETLKKMIEMLTHHSEGYAKDVADKRNAGFDGAVARLTGSITSLQTKLGMAFDNNGRGGLLTSLTSGLAHGVASFAEAPRQLHRLAIEASAAGTAFLAFKSLKGLTDGFGLKGSALALDGAAAQLSRAALIMTGKGALPDVPGAPPGKKKFGGKLMDVARHAAVIGTVVELGDLAWDYIQDDPETPKRSDKPLPAPKNYYGLQKQPMRRGNHLLGPPPAKPYAPPSIAPRYSEIVPSMAGRLPTIESGGLQVRPHAGPMRRVGGLGSLPSFASGTGFGAGLGGGGPIVATVQQPVPVDVTGKVKLEGQATIAVTVKGEGITVEKTASSSSGNIKVSTGSSMPTAKAATGSSPAP